MQDLNALLERNKKARLWQKDIWNDVCCTKWADLWPEDIPYMLKLVEQLNTQPNSIDEYRKWLNRGEHYVSD